MDGSGYNQHRSKDRQTSKIDIDIIMETLSHHPDTLSQPILTDMQTSSFDVGSGFTREQQILLQQMHLQQRRSVPKRSIDSMNQNWMTNVDMNNLTPSTFLAHDLQQHSQLRNEVQRLEEQPMSPDMQRSYSTYDDVSLKINSSGNICQGRKDEGIFGGRSSHITNTVQVQGQLNALSPTAVQRSVQQFDPFSILGADYSNRLNIRDTTTASQHESHSSFDWSVGEIETSANGCDDNGLNFFDDGFLNHSATNKSSTENEVGTISFNVTSVGVSTKTNSEQRNKRQGTANPKSISNSANSIVSTQADRLLAVFGEIQAQKSKELESSSRPNSLRGNPDPKRVIPLPASETLAKRRKLNIDEMSFKVNITQADALLHNSCRLYPNTPSVVESALQLDKEAIRRPVPVKCIGHKMNRNADNSLQDRTLPESIDYVSNNKTSSSEGNKLDTKESKSFIATFPETYAYPINIAMKNGASSDVVKLLARKGPDVLCFPDGPDRCSSIAIAVALGYDKDLIEFLLMTNPSCVNALDRLDNTVLHTAVRFGNDNKGLVSFLCDKLPKAVSYRNFYGHTPLDVAIKSPFCSEDVVDYLQGLVLSGNDIEQRTLSDLKSLDKVFDLGRASKKS